MQSNKPTHVRVVREWCASLGILVAISMTRQEAEMRLAAYVPLLVAHFPDGAFTLDSLDHVARQCAKGFPTYGELAGCLSAWWRGHRPTPERIAPPGPRPPPTPEMVEHVSRVVAETVEFLRSNAQPKEDIRRPKAAYLTPEQLDIVSPLPGGARRHAR